MNEFLKTSPDLFHDSQNRIIIGIVNDHLGIFKYHQIALKFKFDSDLVERKTIFLARVETFRSF